MYSAHLQKSARTTGLYAKVLANIKKCVFCDLREKYIIDEKNGVVLSVNLFPYTDGQLIIIPRRHIEHFKEINALEWQAIKYLTAKAFRLLKKAYQINDCWIIYREGEVAGKTVRHLHLNIIPYHQALHTWNYQKIKLEPIKAAQKLRGVV
jgi:diadenosine tetraphosphate (Ap4A) HIT family hydrolase